MPTPEEDPKTLAALDKIKAILVEHDLWGCVTVSDKERTHWLYFVEPSWSCLHFDPATGYTRMTAKRADFKTPEDHHYVVQMTTGAVFNSRDFAAMMFSHMDMLAKKIQEHVEVEHHPFTDVHFKDDKP